MDATGLGAEVAGSELLLGLYKTIKANQLRNELNKKPVPDYSEVPEMAASRMRANQMSQSGYTPQENAAWEQQLGRTENTTYQHQINTAPNMGAEILAGQDYTHVGAINNHAMSDAQLHRQNIKYADTFAEHLQKLHDMNIQKQLEMTKLAYGAIGQGAKEGLNEIGSAPGQFAAIYSAGQLGKNGVPAGATGSGNYYSTGSIPSARTAKLQEEDTGY